MNWRAIRAMVRRDLKIVLQSKAVLIPMIVLPLVLLVIVPGIAGVLLASTDENDPEITDMREEMGAFFDNLPDSISEKLDQFDNEVQRITYLAFLYFLAPMYLILPLMVANVIAADSFVGEKERKTLEALLYTPTSEQEFYVAKLLAPWGAAIIVGLLGFVGYGIVVNLASYAVMDRLIFPNASWIVLALWVAPAVAGLGLGATVLVSSRVNTFQEAYQFGGMIVLPVILLLLGQMAGVIYFDVPMVLALGFVVWLIDAGILWYGANSFQRGALISRL